MITASCQHIPEKVVSHVGAVCPLALVAVGETERMVCPAAWEAALHVMTTIEVTVAVNSARTPPPTCESTHSNF